MKTYKELREQMNAIREDTIIALDELLKGKDDIEFDKPIITYVTYDEGTYVFRVDYIKWIKGKVYFAEEDNDERWMMRNYEDFTTEDLMELYGDIHDRISNGKGVTITLINNN